jgi:hypothetical protein
MIWPHEGRFPYRAALFRAGCAASVLGPFCWPGLTLHERLLTPVEAFVGLAGGFFDYGLLLCLMRWSSVLHRALAFVLFYGALSILIQWLVRVGIALVRGADFRGFASASLVAFTISLFLGIAAAAFNAIQRTPAAEGRV